ncbi:biogenesis of lysosome- organelles complex 1 subunit 1 [Entophlyctis luteolus]|nr:biogenesis of lysosome- organelles complex 1 subunit 1 [Entophlyctis luteolus]
MDGVLKHHQQEQLQARASRDRGRVAATASINNLSDVLIETVNTPVSLAFSNQQRIESLEASVLAESKLFALNARKWLAMVNKLNASLKELGNVEDWARAIESDVDVVVSVIESQRI